MTRFRSLALTAAVIVGGVVGAPAVGAAGSTPLSTGLNADGQLGNGTVVSRTTPANLVGLPPIVAIASGREHAYGLDENGRVWAWGDNSRGAVGDGTNTDRPTPVQLALTNVVEVEAGHYHGIARRSDGSVWTWGYGAIGQLGLGNLSNQTSPQPVPGLANVIAVAAGRDMSYALLADGTMMGWGNNTFGEVGDGTTIRRSSPVAVIGLTSVAEIAGGRNHALVRRTDGSLWGWGANDFGQLGLGTTTSRSTPVQVIAAGVRHVDTGAEHSVVAMTDGSVRTFGRGWRGQLGLGNTAMQTLPQTVSGLTGIVEVGDGRDQSFAINAAGAVWAWGYNDFGQLGDGTTTQRNAPVSLALTGIASAQGGRGMTIFLPTPGDPPPPPDPTILREWDFTNGLTGWTSVSGFTVDNALGSPTDEPPSGRVSVNNAIGQARLAIGSSPAAACASVDVRIESVGGTTRPALMKLRTAASASVARLQIDTSRRLYVRNDVTGATLTTTAILPLSTWTRVRLCIAVGTAGLIRVEVGGVQVGSWNVNTGTANLTTVQLGDNDARTITANWDALVVTSGTT